MRVTSAIWFAVFKHSETQRGAYVTVVKSGAQQAGAIFVVQNLLDNTFNLFAPAPQMFLSDQDNADRKFEQIFTAASENEVDQYLERQKGFDPDLWIIETESGRGQISLEIVEL